MRRNYLIEDLFIPFMENVVYKWVSEAKINLDLLLRHFCLIVLFLVGCALLTPQLFLLGIYNAARWCFQPVTKEPDDKIAEAGSPVQHGRNQESKRNSR